MEKQVQCGKERENLNEEVGGEILKGEVADGDAKMKSLESGNQNGEISQKSDLERTLLVKRKSMEGLSVSKEQKGEGESKGEVGVWRERKLKNRKKGIIGICDKSLNDLQEFGFVTDILRLPKISFVFNDIDYNKNLKEYLKNHK